MSDEPKPVDDETGDPTDSGQQGEEPLAKANENNEDAGADASVSQHDPTNQSDAPDPAHSPDDEEVVTTGAFAGGEVVRIPSGPQGGDPLVADYLGKNGPTCAFIVLSWTWLLLGTVFVIAGGYYGNTLGPTPPPLGDLSTDPMQRLAEWLQTHFGNMNEVLLGMLGGGLVAAFLARYIHRKKVPATHEPLIVMPLVMLFYLALRDPLIAFSAGAALICGVYLLAMLFRLGALFIGLGPSGMRHADTPEPENGWPIYTVLVPLYKETAIADKIMKHLDAIDYPKDKLDVKLLLEADDPDTITAIERAGVPEWAEVIVVPDDQPKTKPRACNHGLERARGEYLVIFDAEDQPEPDQLKQAVTSFAKLQATEDRPGNPLLGLFRFLLFFRFRAPKKVACLQAHLAYRNHDQNLLTRWFALEYNVWFRRYLPGLVRFGGPIPLGGTSNHFRTDILREVYGWDPFNVTEDCDLGIRLHLKGYNTAILDSVTWEEANSRVGNWIRQRSRWLKGYLVTHLVWFRRPGQLLLRLGPWGAACFFFSIFGVAGLSVINLLLWTVMVHYAIALWLDMDKGYALWDLLIAHRNDYDDKSRDSWPMIITGPDEDPVWYWVSRVLFVGSAVLLFANAIFVFINLFFGGRKGQRGLWWAALISPFYWVLIAIGAWKGAWQLFFKPHYWEKTVHGLDHDSD